MESGLRTARTGDSARTRPGRGHGAARQIRSLASRIHRIHDVIPGRVAGPGGPAPRRTGFFLPQMRAPRAFATREVVTTVNACAKIRLFSRRYRIDTPPARPSGRSATGTARPTPHRGHRMRHADARWCDPIPNGRGGACRAVPVIRSDAVPVITRRATIRTRHDVPIYSCSSVGVSR